MKLEPIFNPHARIKQQTKKSKAEEKDELIQQTKTQVIEKYSMKKSGYNPKGRRTEAQTSGTANNFQKEDGFHLEEKVDA